MYLVHFVALKNPVNEEQLAPGGLMCMFVYVENVLCLIYSFW